MGTKNIRANSFPKSKSPSNRDMTVNFYVYVPTWTLVISLEVNEKLQKYLIHSLYAHHKQKYSFCLVIKLSSSGSYVGRCRNKADPRLHKSVVFNLVFISEMMSEKFCI